MHEIRHVRHELRRRTVSVRRTEQIAPAMRRVIFGGEALADFVTASFDDHVKVFFEDDEGETVARDFTPRRFDPLAHELTIDFVLHDGAPSTRWVESLRIGDLAQIGGPRSSRVVPLDFDWYLMIGDETALPAIARRLEELPGTAPVFAMLQVASEADRLALTYAESAQVLWLARGEDDANGALVRASRGFVPPPGDGHVWIAGERSLARAVHAIFSTLPRTVVQAAEYWRRGEAASHERIDESPMR